MMLDKVMPIDVTTAKAFVKQHHYSEVMPRITKASLGAFKDGHMVGCATLGFGTRPLHTIRKLFPSLGTADYLELGKLCMSDEMPKNTESYFIAHMLKWLHHEFPKLKLLFSWADGIIGKPGYVYQASNFYYGGFIWTEMYLDQQGNRIHVRTLQGDPRLSKSAGRFKTRAFAEVQKLGYQKYFGLQFRYCYPLCSPREWEHLKAESTVKWARGGYPKTTDCQWKRQTGLGQREVCVLPAGIRTKYKAKEVLKCAV